MSTLAVVEEILRETQVPMSVRQIVEFAGDRLPTKSKTPDTVVARDISMDIKKKGEESLFVRSSPGRYTMREIHMRMLAEQEMQATQQAEAAAQAAPGAIADTAQEPAQMAAAAAAATAAAAVSPIVASGAASDERIETTPVLSSAMRAERAATLPAKKAAHADEQAGTVR